MAANSNVVNLFEMFVVSLFAGVLLCAFFAAELFVANQHGFALGLLVNLQ